MPGFLIATQGDLEGLIVRFEEGHEWVIGRDSDVSYQCLEDPMVSRKHVIIRLENSKYAIENLSATNPALINDQPIEEPTTLNENDTVSIGTTLFTFTTTPPEPSSLDDKSVAPSNTDTPPTGPSPDEPSIESPTIYEEPEDLNILAFHGTAETRWMIKVISGPNAGSEFGVPPDSSIIIGKDPNACDILFQDLSVSRQHAKITTSPEETVYIEDLGSLNKVLINGQEITEATQLHTQDLIALGTTSFLIIDQQQTRETIISHKELPDPTSEHKEHADTAEPALKTWKETIIPKKTLVIAISCAVLLIASIAGVFSLFKTTPIAHSIINEPKAIAKALEHFPEVEFSYTESTKTLFLLGHVMTEINHQEMAYLIKGLQFIHSIEDNIIIDELVWENTNPLIMKNPTWRQVLLTSISPGHFVLRGYVASLQEAGALTDYMNRNFPYLNKLDNQVVIENTLEAQIQQLLIEKQFGNVTFQFANGELVIAGRVPTNRKNTYETVINNIKKLAGIRIVKSFVVFATPTSDTIDISSKYTVTGSSKKGNTNQYIVVNGKILSTGSVIDGMKVIKINNDTILLEKDGIKYNINYT